MRMFLGLIFSTGLSWHLRKQPNDYLVHNGVTFQTSDFIGIYSRDQEQTTLKGMPKPWAAVSSLNAWNLKQAFW